ncbi:MAG TPA: NnrS family protein [Ramlibacter sp.]|uniref:NnrS family protein n=1 Tax=Ramlibacter sp. TaxID=1917967 RepID=UPI002D7E62B5|nr:NnrS family protein [Ramlibacter sp.]HET8746096.1 NnrS family protein [Ramlibacter sp.]
MVLLSVRGRFASDVSSLSWSHQLAAKPHGQRARGRSRNAMSDPERLPRHGPAGPDRGPQPRRLVAANLVFFPMATVYAIVALPASVHAMLARTEAFPALASTTGHAHEMLFGFALAVVVGNQLGRISLARLALLTGLWVLARATFLFAPASLAAAGANIAFSGLLAALLAPRLLAAAKKWRNEALPVVLAAICACGIAFQLARQAGFAAAEHAILAMAVLLFAMLLLFMGGRILAPALAGQFYRQGSDLAARVQPQIEGGLIIAMGIAIAASPFAGWRPFALSAGAATAISGVLALVRLWRWRLWALQGRPDLLCLAAGYGWLALGLLAYGAALAVGRYQTAALHLITVGALGTLTLNVMAMTWTLKAGEDPSRDRLRLAATVLVGAAALARVLGGVGVSDPLRLFVIASTLWSGAFALLLAILVRARVRKSARVQAIPKEIE